MTEDTTDTPQARCGACRADIGGDGQPAQLRCARCQKQVYCSVKCQRGDWKFHKRLCTCIDEKRRRDEAEADREDAKRKAKEAKKGGAPAAATKCTAPKAKTEVVRLEADSEDEISDWYRHRETKLPECQQSRPQKIDANAAHAEAVASLPPAASAWNAAGTWEERDLSDRAREALETRLGLVKAVELRAAKANGEASACCVRGQTKYVWELRFSAEVWENGAKVGLLKCEDFNSEEPLCGSDVIVTGTSQGEEVRKEIVEAAGHFVHELKGPKSM